MKNRGACLLITLSLLGRAAVQAAVPDRGFSAAMSAAMTRMMDGMHANESHGADVDRYFVAMMIPHHQGAIDMAVAELRYGRNPQLKRIAQEIIVDQQQEIAVMDLAIGAPLPAAAPAPTQLQSSSMEH